MAAILTPRVAAFLERASARPFQYGAHDCALCIADWGRELTGKDGAADLRGRYKTKIGCARVLTREGGLVAVVERCALTIGMQQVATPRAGDVGVIMAKTVRGDELACAISLDGRRWALLSTAGVYVGADAAPVAKAWGLR